MSEDTALSYQIVLYENLVEQHGAENVRSAIEEALNYGYSEMQNVTPVLTGYLKSSEGYSVDSDTEGELYADAPYAGFVNYGTSRQDANPFFDTGIEATENKLREILGSL